MTTGKKSIADKLRERGFPQIPEDQYQENISHFVATGCSCEDEPMTTDRKICTKENPRPKDAPVNEFWAHPDAKRVYDGGWAQEYESFECPNCGLYFSVEIAQ